MFVPLVDLSKTWDDSTLYDYFELNQEERVLIESTMRPMELGGDD